MAITRKGEYVFDWWHTGFFAYNFADHAMFRNNEDYETAKYGADQCVSGFVLDGEVVVSELIQALYGNK